MDRHANPEVLILLKRVERDWWRTWGINYDQQAPIQDLEEND